MKRPIPKFEILLSVSRHTEMKMLPTAPTMKMLDAAIHALDGCDLSKLSRKDRAQVKAAVRYQAMLAAAPIAVWTEDGVVQSVDSGRP